MTVISEKLSEERYQISKKEFRAWLESKEENVVVGQSLVYGNDPIATAIVELSKTSPSSNEKENEWETVVIDSEESSTRLNTNFCISNPRWVNRFIEKIDRDTLGDEPVNITAKQALKVLTEVEEDVGKAVDIERMQEIEKAKELFSKDSYSMSIGELLSLYEKKELVVSTNSSYTSVTQQNEFIESIFLDLPSQPLFVKVEREMENGEP